MSTLGTTPVLGDTLLIVRGPRRVFLPLFGIVCWVEKLCVAVCDEDKWQQHIDQTHRFARASKQENGKQCNMMLDLIWCICTRGHGVVFL